MARWRNWPKIQKKLLWITQGTICGRIFKLLLVWGVSGWSEYFNRHIYYQVILLPPSSLILIWNNYPFIKHRSTLNTRLLSNSTTPTSEDTNTTPSLWLTSAHPTCFQIHHRISTMYSNLSPILHTPTIHFLQCVYGHINTHPRAGIPLSLKIEQASLFICDSSLLTHVLPSITFRSYSIHPWLIFLIVLLTQVPEGSLFP